MTEVTGERARTYLAMDEDDLFGALVPDTERDAQMYSLQGMTARGKQIFRAVFPKAKAVVCDAYRAHRDSEGTTVDLVVLLATSLAGSPILVGVPALPFAALVVRIGLAELCN